MTSRKPLRRLQEEYRRATDAQRAVSLSWLAGSFYRHGHQDAALSHIAEARQLTRDPARLAGLERLERRIHAKIRKFGVRHLASPRL